MADRTPDIVVSPLPGCQSGTVHFHTSVLPQTWKHSHGRGGHYAVVFSSPSRHCVLAGSIHPIAFRPVPEVSCPPLKTVVADRQTPTACRQPPVCLCFRRGCKHRWRAGLRLGSCKSPLVPWTTPGHEDVRLRSESVPLRMTPVVVGPITSERGASVPERIQRCLLTYYLRCVLNDYVDDDGGDDYDVDGTDITVVITIIVKNVYDNYLHSIIYEYGLWRTKKGMTLTRPQ